jgi:excisionase family DNA binding protein
MPQAAMIEPLLTTSSVARRLHKSEGTVRRLANAGVLPFVRTSSGERLFQPSDVDRAVNQQRQTRRNK